MYNQMSILLGLQFQPFSKLCRNLNWTLKQSKDFFLIMNKIMTQTSFIRFYKRKSLSKYSYYNVLI